MLYDLDTSIREKSMAARKAILKFRVLWEKTALMALDVLVIWLLWPQYITMITESNKVSKVSNAIYFQVQV